MILGLSHSTLSNDKKLERAIPFWEIRFRWVLFLFFSKKHPNLYVVLLRFYCSCNFHVLWKFLQVAPVLNSRIQMCKTSLLLSRRYWTVLKLKAADPIRQCVILDTSKWNTRFDGLSMCLCFSLFFYRPWKKAKLMRIFRIKSSLINHAQRPETTWRISSFTCNLVIPNRGYKYSSPFKT